MRELSKEQIEAREQYFTDMRGHFELQVRRERVREREHARAMERAPLYGHARALRATGPMANPKPWILLSRLCTFWSRSLSTSFFASCRLKTVSQHRSDLPSLTGEQVGELAGQMQSEREGRVRAEEGRQLAEQVA